MPSAQARYLAAARDVWERLTREEAETVERVAGVWSEGVAAGGMILAFASGHSRMAVEEAFPRYGSYPAFFPMVELSLTFHTQVVGNNGQRQAMFLERQSELGRVVWQNFHPGPNDRLLCISHSGTSAVTVEVALGGRERGLHVTAITSLAHSRASKPEHPSGRRLFECADEVIDSHVPAGDAVADVGWNAPVGPLSSLATLLIVNWLKVAMAEHLAADGVRLPVLASALTVGEEAAHHSFEAAYEEFWRRSRHL
jgi:uncharacterized phosphosugar-binding protein